MPFGRFREYFASRFGGKEIPGGGQTIGVNEKLKVEAAHKAAEAALQTETRPGAREKILELAGLGIEIPEGQQLVLHNEWKEENEGFSPGKGPRDSYIEQYWKFVPEVQEPTTLQVQGAEKLKHIGGQDIHGRIGPTAAVQGVETVTTRIFYYEDPSLDGLPPGYVPDPKYQGVYENYYVREPGQPLSAKNIKWIGGVERMIGQKPRRVGERRGGRNDDLRYR